MEDDVAEEITRVHFTLSEFEHALIDRNFSQVLAREKYSPVPRVFAFLLYRALRSFSLDLTKKKERERESQGRG